MADHVRAAPENHSLPVGFIFPDGSDHGDCGGYDGEIKDGGDSDGVGDKKVDGEGGVEGGDDYERQNHQSSPR